MNLKDAGGGVVHDTTLASGGIAVRFPLELDPKHCHCDSAYTFDISVTHRWGRPPATDDATDRPRITVGG